MTEQWTAKQTDARSTVLLGYRSLVRNVVVQIPKFDTKPNPKPNITPALTLALTQTLALAITLTLCLYFSDK